MRTMYILRGLPGSGKSTMGTILRLAYADYDDGDYTHYSVTCSADHYFTANDGSYSFDVKKLPQAHKQCRERAAAACADPHNSAVIIDNTHTQRWEMEPYLKLAAMHDMRVQVVSIFDGGLDDAALVARGVHNTPIEAIARMRARYEHDWANANPNPPAWVR